MKRTPLIIIAVFSVAMVIGLILMAQFREYLRMPAFRGPARHYEVKKGIALSQLASDLTAKQIIRHPYYFLLLAKLRRADTSIKAGEYEFARGITPEMLLQQMVMGKVVQHEITFIAGWRFQQIMAALNHNKNIQHSLAGLKPAAIMRQLEIPTVNPEGMFFPDTYHFPKGTSDKQLLQTAFNLMQQHLKQTWQQRAQPSPYKNAYQGLIVASLVEKETAIEQERKLIASVIINRLRKDMPLQIDPTVIYSLGDQYQGKLSSQNLRVKSPYNTYRHRGLPPSPIAIPGAPSLVAAFHPASSDYLYFVAKGDGHHVFSRSLKEHDRAVKQYQQRQEKQHEQHKQ